MYQEQYDFPPLPDAWPQWELTDVIGVGAYGTVYRAHNTQNDMQCAVKIIRLPKEHTEAEYMIKEYHSHDTVYRFYEEMAKDYCHEIQLLRDMHDCPNIVKCDDFCMLPCDDSPGWMIYMRMELLQSFSDYYLEHTFCEADIIHLGKDICTALSACHQKGILHRDIKPDNILLSADGTYKLGDFGTAKNLSKTATALSVQGTYSYMAPEVYLNKAYDNRADIYSLGLVLYRLLNCNREPFVDPNKQLVYHKDKEEALQRRMNGEPFPAPVNASAQMADILSKACAFEPEQRYSNIEEFLADLKAVENGTYHIKKKSQDCPHRHLRKRFCASIAAIVLLICCVIGATAYHHVFHILDSGKCGENAYWTLYKNGTLIIDGSGSIQDCEQDAFLAGYRNIIERVEIKHGITEIGTQVFVNCIRLSEVHLPEGLTAIGDDAFANCTILSSIFLPSTVSKLGESTFNNCISLSDINFPTGLHRIEAFTFQSCGFTQLTIPDSVTFIGLCAISYCPNLTEITISGTPVLEEYVFEESNIQTVHASEQFLSHLDLNNIFRTTPWLSAQEKAHPNG